MRSEISAITGEIEFDLDELQAKYLAERDKRLRLDGLNQYVEVKAEFSRYVDDPYVEPGFARDSVHDHVQFAVIGGGFAGLLVAARLRERGFETIRMVESGGDFGGTWYWNRYPGAMCDVESYVYLPLLEELGYMPRHKYAFAPEILDHSKAIARRFRLYENALLQTTVTGLQWDEAARRWTVFTNRGDRFTAQFVAMANGPLNRPKLPGIQGINEFKGHTFHTSRWDYRYTGGDASGGLVGLKDKRVGVVGTGATAVQCVPHLGQWSKQLYVFQRTPSSVDARNNAVTDPKWAASLEAGWQRRRRENFNTLVTGGEADEDLVHDGWTDIFRGLTGRTAENVAATLGRELTPRERAEITLIADHRKMNQIRARIGSIVDDPAAAESLKPWYRQFCKRPCFHDEYLQTFNLPNVKLVDTDGRGIERLTESAVVAGGQNYEVDCLIFATGFEFGNSYTRRAGYDVVGRRGRRLSEHWSEGPRTLHGLTSHGFPNCFFLGFTQTAITVNAPQALEEQADHLAYIVDEAVKRGAAVLEPTAEAEQAYVNEFSDLARIGRRFYTECTPSYFNSEGAVGDRQGFSSNVYGAGPVQFFKKLAEWRADGGLSGLELG